MGDLPPEADGDIGESRVKQLDLVKVLVQKISVAVKASCYWLGAEGRSISPLDTNERGTKGGGTVRPDHLRASRLRDKSPALPASACKCGDGLVWEFCQ
ncbi:hypothetical protein CTAM01_15281 [Colletotrichum tamarilloi]|uniref:Uncharacterized protein n=1 Tax=Colletotrichum tamarilloi TaxID=1209934 RepID=A0ABQ9QLV9_9PEZI|nr:uncharacterized protein CTAM01_15281 [Colletotrichum tamarilloi]KAK1477011.1 hypothetical protein CTAM01_15281 [Colletotrichum tamarilloi]